MVSRTKRRAERGCPNYETRTTLGHLPRLWAPSQTLAQSCVLRPTPTRTAKATAAVVPPLQSPKTQAREGRGCQVELSNGARGWAGPSQ